MLNKIIKAFVWIRKRYCPQRIYKYGKLGLALHDDRTIKEKVFDYFNDLLFGIKIRYEFKKQGDTGFRPYFDWSLGLWINDRGAVKDIERKTGLEYVTIKDWEKESAKQRGYKDAAFESKLEKRMGEVVKDINQGRSFVKENAEKRRDIYRKYGKPN